MIAWEQTANVRVITCDLILYAALSLRLKPAFVAVVSCCPDAHDRWVQQAEVSVMDLWPGFDQACNIEVPSV
jgi:hypothetical protein